MHVEAIAHIQECAIAPVQEPCVQLVFAGAYRNADALRGIEGFSHLWLVWGAAEGEDAAAAAGGVDTCAAEDSAGPACEGAATTAVAGGAHARAGGAAADAAHDACGADGAAVAADAGGTLPFHAPQTPAGLGIACARLEGVRRTGTQGTVLVLSGVPLAPGTPVYDVKPYLPYADAHPQAGEVHDDAR